LALRDEKQRRKMGGEKGKRGKGGGSLMGLWRDIRGDKGPSSIVPEVT